MAHGQTRLGQNGPILFWVSKKRSQSRTPGHQTDLLGWAKIKIEDRIEDPMELQ